MKKETYVEKQQRLYFDSKVRMILDLINRRDTKYAGKDLESLVLIIAIDLRTMDIEVESCPTMVNRAIRKEGLEL
jgi:hypothetical protein